MRRRSQRSSDACVCPTCKKVVEFGVVCHNCSAWFHATEGCCGDALADAFLRTGKGPWCCLNCSPHVGEQPPAPEFGAPAAEAELLDWRRAFRIFSGSCDGCGLVVKGPGNLHCAECGLSFHAHPNCTGLSEETIRSRAADPEWRCATCTIRTEGTTVPNSVVVDDCSLGAEAVPIPMVNEVDMEPPQHDFVYAQQVAWKRPSSLQQRSTLPLADWGGRCIGQEACNYCPAVGNGEQPVAHGVARTGGSAYNNEGCLLFARDNIFECNGSSGCAPDCFNRVVGRGVRARLQVFKTLGRGWGVRTLDGLRAGAFVCEYTGELLLDKEAETSGLEVDDSYLFNLDGEEKSLSKRRRTGSSDARVSAAALENKNPPMCVDASKIGSVARFLNHCCEPNLFVQSVFVEYSRAVHRIGIFAARDIMPYEELTYDYGYVVGSVEGKTLRCLCGAPGCRDFLF